MPPALVYSVYPVYSVMPPSAAVIGNWELGIGYWDILIPEELFPRPYTLVPRPFWFFTQAL